MKKTKAALRSISTSRGPQLARYSRLARAFKRTHPVCEVCRARSTKDIHHRAGRWGELLCEQKYWLAVCRKCHDWITVNGKAARQMGFTVDKPVEMGLKA